MNLQQLLETSTDKQNFTKIRDYFDFSLKYLEFIKNNLQAVIVSQNETHYRFFQYKEDGTYNITRPINSNLMLSFENFEQQQIQAILILKKVFPLKYGNT